MYHTTRNNASFSVLSFVLYYIVLGSRINKNKNVRHYNSGSRAPNRGGGRLKTDSFLSCTNLFFKEIKVLKPIHIYIYASICIYAAVSMGKRKTEVQAIVFVYSLLIMQA